MTKQNLTCQLYYNGVWNDADGRVRTENGVTVVRGEPDEGSVAKPSSLSLTFDNRDGWALPTNPVSPLYATSGRYTPIRCWLAPGVTSGPAADLTDPFTRSVASGGWGVAPNGNTWTAVGAGGTLATSDYYVSSNRGQHFVNGANAYRITYADGAQMMDGDWSATVIAPQATGADLESSIIYRMTSLVDYGQVRLHFTTGNAVQIKAYSADGSGQLSSTVTTGITHTGTGQPLRIRVRAVGREIAVKVWVASTSEPATWSATFTDFSPIYSGSYGVRTGRATSNTNSSNPTVSYDDFSATFLDVIAHQEINEWVPTSEGNFDVLNWRNGTVGTQGDATTSITAGGILYRLGAGADPLRSAMYRSVTRRTGVTGYWPMEDPPGSTEAASAVAGVPAAVPVTTVRYTDPDGNPVPPGGAPRFGGDPGASGSAPLVDLTSGGTLRGYPGKPTGAYSTGYAIDFLFRMEPGNKISSEDIFAWNETGTYGRFTVNLTSSSVTVFHAFTQSGSFQGSAVGSGSYADGGLHHFRYIVSQSGGNYLTYLYIDGVLKANGANFTPPMAGTIGQPIFWEINPLEDSGATMPSAIGHVVVWGNPFPSDLPVIAAFGHLGETPADRWNRLCGEENISHQLELGSFTTTDSMGPQRVDTLINLLNEAVRTGDAIMYEPKNWLGLIYRSREAILSQSPAFTRSYSGGGIKRVFPSIDTKDAKNDVTGQNVDGKSYRSSITTGMNGVTAIGRVTDSINVNYDSFSQLQRRVEWELGKGTITGARYPSITFDLDAVPELVLDIQKAEIGRTFSITGMEADAISQIVRSVRQVIMSNSRKVSLMGTPDKITNGGLYDTLPARWDSGSSSTSSAVNSTQTTISVATTNTDDLWATSGSFPFDIMVGGERMTVSGITSATSPQSFTVTRSVNGIVKAHGTGTEVHVYPQPIYAL